MPQLSSETEQRLRLAVDLAQLGTFDWDMVHDRIDGDERLYSILGLEPGTVLGSLADCLGRVHPDDRARLEETAWQVDAEGASRTQEYRIVRPEGGVRWVASRTKTETDAAGKPLRMVGVIQDIDDLKKAESELRNSAQRLHHLSGQLLQAHETERRRIARELHDEIGQSLTAAIIHVQMVEQKPEAAAFSADLGQGLALLNTTLQQVRAMSLELRPTMLDDLGLVPTLKWHLDRVGQRSGLRIQLTARGLPSRVPADLETVCYRIVQESLTNIVRHARATDVRVIVTRSGDDLQLTIRDNGVGFDVNAAQATARAGDSLGLLSVAERVTLVGGTLDLDSAPGQGCRISVRLPLNHVPLSVEMSGEGPAT